MLIAGLEGITECHVANLFPKAVIVNGGFSTSQGVLRSKDVNVGVCCVNLLPTIGGIQQVLVKSVPSLKGRVPLW